MTKIDIISGFLGAGKTTLIRKLIAEAFPGEKLVLIENEFGEISIDGGFLADSGVQISEMSSGCICCSLVGDFGKALADVQAQFSPDRIIIEPSGVGKLSDVIAAAEKVAEESGTMQLNSFLTVADATKVKVYMKNFGEFYNNQVSAAGTIVLSRTDKLSQEKLEAVTAMLHEVNPAAAVITTPWSEIGGADILRAVEKSDLAEELLREVREHLHDDDDEDEECCCHHHHHDEDDEHHECHHHHHDDDDEDEHEHHHHDDEDEHEHHHHHEDDDEHECCHHHHGEDEHEHHHHHHHHHGHDADEVFTSWGMETPKQFTAEELTRVLKALDSGDYGKILRAKGIVPATDGSWLHFDYVPEETSVRTGTAEYTGRFCVIGAELKEDGLRTLFGV